MGDPRATRPQFENEAQIQLNSFRRISSMKKNLVLILALSLGLAFSFISYAQGMGGGVEGKDRATEGWIDKDTFRIAASGVPIMGTTEKTKRQESAKRAAILNAQYRILEKFKGSRIEGAAGKSDFGMTGTAVAQEVKGTIRGGHVVSEKYDAEDICEIIYEVKAKDLKNKVEAFGIGD
jgi:hypothetical protein